jgi:DNA mismatch repair ATPase MutS
MKKPLYDLRQIEERLNVVETLITNHSIRQMLHESFLRTVPDISHIIRRFSQGKAGLQVKPIIITFRRK